MPFTTYNELLTSIATWLARDDLTANIPDFVTLFEAEAARRLGVRPMELTTTLTPSSGSVALPTDFLGVRRLTWTGSTRVDLTYQHPTYIQSMYPTTPQGTPLDYTIEGGNILIRPTDATALELVYHATNAAVSSSLNWLFTSHPDVYLFGSLAEAKGFIDNLEKLSAWGARRDATFDSIERLDFRYRGPMSIQTTGPTP